MPGSSLRGPTVAKAGRLSRESSVGLACAEAASGAVRPLPGLTGPPDMWKIKLYSIVGVEGESGEEDSEEEGESECV